MELGLLLDVFSRGGEHARWMRGGDAHMRYWRGKLDTHTPKPPCVGVQGGCKMGMLMLGDFCVVERTT